MIKKGKLVEIICGKDKGKKGEIIEISKSENKAKVKGINLIKKHEKTTKEKKMEGNKLINDTGTNRVECC